MLNKSDQVKTCAILLEEFNQKGEQPHHPEKIVFDGVGENDVYNITAPFEDEGEWVIAGRVEPRDSEYSKVYFFIRQGNKWVPRDGAPILELQDPFFTRINGQLIVGGVQIFPHPTKEGALGWRTVFYKGDRIAELRKYTQGPDGMKDLRIIELHDGSIGVFTRPQGEKGGRGKIGFTRVSSLDQLTVEVIDEAPLLEGQFIDDEWGGSNELHLLSNGLIGVLGHIACFDEADALHYYPMTFVFDPDTRKYSDISLIAKRKAFLPGEAKQPRLDDVVFSGGLVRNADGTATLYAGISDAEAQKITIEDPFLPFEKETRE